MEEVSTRNGHLVGLWLTKRIRPWHSMKRSIAMIHEQGGLAIIAHPLPPYPLCASEGTVRRLMDEADPIYHPDALEGFNPTTARMRWSRKAPALAEELGIAAVAGSDAHVATKVGSAVTLFRGHCRQESTRRARWWQRSPAYCLHRGQWRRRCRCRVRFHPRR